MVQFNFTYGSDITIEQRIGFEMAAAIWGIYLTDDVEVNLHIGASDNLNGGDAVGGAVPILHEQTYGVFREYYEQDVTYAEEGEAPSVDQQASDSLQTGNTVDVWVEDELLTGNTEILLTSAQAKALGMDTALNLDGGATWDRDLVDGEALDGYIIVNNSFDWNYDFTRSGEATEGTLDFLSMALHEIGHNLGFISGLDGTIDIETLYSGETHISDFTTLDLFRHTLESATTENPDGSVSSVSAGGDAYLSVDGGQTNIGDLSTGERGGDGYQASHWKRMQNAMGIMDPTLAYKERMSLSDRDLQAMDVLGWDIDYSQAGKSLDLQALLLQAEAAAAGDLGVDTAFLTENRGHQNKYNLGYRQWFQLFEDQIIDVGYSQWWQVFELGYASWQQQNEDPDALIDMGYSQWWQSFEEQVIDMGYSQWWQSFEEQVIDMGYSQWWQVLEMGYSQWWQKLETYFSKIEAVDGIESGVLRDSGKGFDLETGRAENIAPNNPKLDFHFQLNDDGSRLVLNILDANAEVALLDSQDFSSINDAVLDNISLSQGVSNITFDYNDVVVIKTADGNVFKLGRFLRDSRNEKVDFDYQYLATVTQDASGSTTTSTTPTPDVVTGGRKDDILAGMESRDLIDGGKGDDLIDGKLGDDILLGDEGDDMIYGFDGNDVIYGGKGDDLLSGEKDNDKIFGESGHDILAGGNGNDLLDGGEGKDLLKGDAGDDVLDGGADNDDLDGDAGRDVLIGNEGADLLNGGDGDDELYGDRYGSESASGSSTDLKSIAESAGINHEEDTAFRMRVEAEDMRLINYGKEAQDFSSGGEVITTGGAGQARTRFSGPTGTYDISVGYYDENDGYAAMNVKVGGELVDSWQLTQKLGSWLASPDTKVTRTIQGVTLNSGQIIELEGIADNGEYARFDYIDIVLAGAGGTAEGESYNLVKPTTRLDTNPYRVEAESMTLSGNYQVESNRQDFTSGDSVIRVSSGSGTATTTFTGNSGKYNIFVGYLDESGGQSTAILKINGAVQDNWQFSRNNDSAEYRLAGLDVVLNQGDVIELQGFANSGEQARIDYIDLLPVLAVELDDEVDISGFAEDVVATPTSKVRIEAETINLTGDYKIEEKDFASGLGYVAAEDGFSASTTFTGETGLYNVVLGYYDQEDAAQFSARINGTELGSWLLTTDLDGSANEKSFVTKTLATSVLMNQGATFDFTAIAGDGDKANIDFIEFTPFDPYAPVRIEAEFMNASGEYSLEEYDFASSGRVLRSEKEETYKALQTSTEFTGQSGVYDIVVGYYDGNDGIAQLSATLGGVQLESWLSDQDLGSKDVERRTFITRTISDVTLNAGDVFGLKSIRDGGDYGAIDYVEFVQQETGATDTPAVDNSTTAIQLEIEDMQLSGKVKIKETTFAYGGGYVNTDNDETGFTASTLFTSEAGYYNVILGYYDENDGNASLSVKLNEDVLDSWVLDQQLGSKDAGVQSFTTRTVASAVKLNKTDLIQISGLKEGGENASVDYIKFVEVDSPTSSPTTIISELSGNDDVLRGGTGNDRLFGGEGNDILYGEDEFDRGVVSVEGNNDILVGGSGDDKLYGNSGNDFLYGDYNSGSSGSSEPITTIILMPETLTFQQNVNGYSGTADTTLSQWYSNSSYGNSSSMGVDNQNGSSDNQGATHSLLRFDDIFGRQSGQVASNSVINSAFIELEVNNSGSSFGVFEMLQSWTESATWNSMNNGIQYNGVEAVATPLAVTGSVSTGTLRIDVTESLQAWQADPTQNKGWAFISTGNDGVDFYSSESGLAPRLVVNTEKAEEVVLPSPSELPNGFDYNGHRYLLTDSAMTWEASQAYAKGLGGNLVTINSAAEEQWLRSQFSSSEAFWIGMNDRLQEGQYEWASGEAVSYTNWSGSGPDNYYNQDYGVIHWEGSQGSEWRDEFSDGAYQNINNVWQWREGLRGLIEITLPDTTVTDNVNTDGGNDTLEGGSGNDTLEGGLGDDRLDGSDVIAKGAFEVDILGGGLGQDRFILGDTYQSYYISDGAGDYAIIKDFDASVDILQLHGSAGSYSHHQQGNHLLLSYGQELIATIENVNSLDLQSSSISFV